MTYRRSGQSGPPAWLVVVTAAMLVFGGYFIWTGIRRYVGGAFQGFAQATEVIGQTATANVPPTRDSRFTPAPTRTPVPECQQFIVIVPEAIVRECASVRCAIAGTRREGETVCVLQRDYTNSEWYIVDLDDSPFFTTIAYMHESLLRPLNPTLTPSITHTLLPTLTPLPPTASPSAGTATSTPVPSVTAPSVAPSPAASATPPLTSG